MYFNSEQQIDELLAAFAERTLPKSAWTHQAHLAIAGILVWSDPDTALNRARDGIIVLNQAHGTVNSATSGYHETLTVFWIRVVTPYCAARRTQSRLTVLNDLVTQFPSDWFRSYYSYDVVKSTKARSVWIEPDLLSMP